MKILAIAFLFIFFCAVFALPQTPAQNEGRFSVAGLGEHEVEEFFVSFKEAVAKGDQKKVASLMEYPIRVTLASGRSRKVRNAAEFVTTYPRIFDEHFKQVIAGTEVKNLWAKWSGVAMAKGEIWFNGIGNPKQPKKYTIRITTINGRMRS